LYKILRTNINQAGITHPESTIIAVLDGIVHAAAVLTKAGFSIKAHEILRDAIKIATKCKSRSHMSAINLLLGKINKPIQNPTEVRDLYQSAISFSMTIIK